MTTYKLKEHNTGWNIYNGKHCVAVCKNYKQAKEYLILLRELEEHFYE